jgi:oxygen-independent coproporphyrinogen III oxidase
MSGIYIHVPFCKQACFYCDFHFSTSLAKKTELIDAMVKEVEIKHKFIGDEIIHTIYFGGGTPSILSESEIKRLFDSIHQYFNISENAEITFEANPDDLTEEKLNILKKASVNRLSIGIQTFNDSILTYLNRAHNSKEAINCIINAQKVGFNNINIDLIYGAEPTTNAILLNDLSIIESLKIQHVSAYNLTIEQGTVFGNHLKKGKILPINDSKSAEQYQLIENHLGKNGFEHYEISNYALPGYYSKHNSSYWKQKKYIGIGPSAHSYDGKTRHYTIKNNALYLKSLLENKLPIEEEILTRKNKINEFLMTGLRTNWGCDLAYLEKLDYDLVKEKNDFINQKQNEGIIAINDNHLYLTEKGKLFTDSIVLEFMV